MLTFLVFLGCSLLFGAILGVAAMPLLNRLLRWKQLHVVGRAVRRTGREEVLAAIERRQATPDASCATPDPVFDQLREAAGPQRLTWLAPVLTAVFLLCGAALSAWLFYG